jgi:hypothetical protein
MLTLSFSTEEVWEDGGYLMDGEWRIREYMHINCEECGRTEKVWLSSLGVSKIIQMRDHVDAFHPRPL